MKGEQQIFTRGIQSRRFDARSQDWASLSCLTQSPILWSDNWIDGIDSSYDNGIHAVQSCIRHTGTIVSGTNRLRVA